MVKVYVSRRENLTRKFVLSVNVASVILALVAAGFIFLFYGCNPVIAYRKIFIGAIGSTYGLSEAVVKLIPLLLCAVGLAVPFEAGIWNIGAEGQLLLGAIGASWVALTFKDFPSFFLLPTMFIAGFLGGALWGFIPGFLRAKMNVNEVITSLMLNYVALKILEYLVYGPWKGSEEWGFPYTNKFPPAAQIPRLEGTRIHYLTLAIAISLSILMFLLLKKSKFGFEVRAVGGGLEAANYAGISFFKVCVLAMMISGGLAGLAGVGEVAGIHHRLRMGVSPGYGYTAIVVSWLGRLNPLVIIPVSFLFGGLLVGGDIIQVSLGFPFSIVDIFNGLILFFVIGGEFFVRYRVSLRR